MIQYKLDCTQGIECLLIKYNSVEIGRHLQNLARHETDVKSVLAVYCMHIFKANPEVIVPMEEIMMAILNSKCVLAGLRTFHVQFMECADLRG
jgi:hypothetical protein